jgi:hypothetical protein
LGDSKASSFLGPWQRSMSFFMSSRKFWALPGSRQSPAIFRTGLKDWNKLSISMVTIFHTDLIKYQTIILTQLFIG